MLKVKPNNLIDSHCHIVFRNFQEDLEEVAARWRAAGVRSLLHSCVEPSEISSIRALADRFPEMRYSVGVHPLDTKHWQEDTIDILREAANDDNRVVAIGELGLDLFRDSNIQEQIRILKQQLDLAVELHLPVIIHCREAAHEMLNLIREFNKESTFPAGVMHCWGGTPAEMNSFLELGLYISFSGTVTFSKAKQTQDCAAQVPQDRFLVETDCPFLAPVPYRGKRNEPANVQEVAAKLAELRGQTFSHVADSSTANARRLFDLP